MISIFEGCDNLLSLDISNFDLTSLTHPINFFNNITSLQYLNLSKINMGNNSDLSYLLYNLQSLISIDL